jgi:hypothetical protein
MFKSHFLSLVDVNCLDINLALIEAGKEYTKLNKETAILYHRLFGIPKAPKKGVK